jgi:hypothetical protein
MTQYNLPEDVLDIIKGLEKRVDKLEKLARTGATTIDNGALLMKKDGKLIVAIGDLKAAGYNYPTPDGSSQMGLIINRDTGELALSLWDSTPTGPDGYQQHMSFWDRTGHIILGDDTTSGWGLALPWLPGALWLQTNPIAWWPNTIDAAFGSAWDCFYRVKHPKLYINFMMYVDSATTGEAKLLIDNVQYGPTISLAGAGYATYDQTLLLDQAMLQTGFKQIQIQSRRVSGTGKVYVTPRMMYGRQS